MERFAKIINRMGRNDNFDMMCVVLQRYAV